MQAKRMISLCLHIQQGQLVINRQLFSFLWCTEMRMKAYLGSLFKMQTRFPTWAFIACSFQSKHESINNIYIHIFLRLLCLWHQFPHMLNFIFKHKKIIFASEWTLYIAFCYLGHFKEMKKFFNSYLIPPSNQAFLNGSEAAGLTQAMQ